jgi:aspartyl protease family protein
MGMEDQERFRDPSKAPSKPSGLTTGLKLAPLGIVLFWALAIGGVYWAFDQVLKPKPAVVSANGDLVISRSRDGHFYVPGLVNGEPVRFLVDTGASLVTVGAALANKARLADGHPTTFQTANGSVAGRVVSGVTVAIGPVSVTNVRVGVGLFGLDDEAALLGQSFLSKFDVLLQKDQMVLRPR